MVSIVRTAVSFFFFFFNDTATTEIYTLSLHDALPIFSATDAYTEADAREEKIERVNDAVDTLDRKSTRLNSSHQIISYAVFCLKKKKEKQDPSKIQCQTLETLPNNRTHSRQYVT